MKTALGVVCLMALPALAGAQNANDEQSLIQRGVELREKGQDEAALQEFRRAYDIAASPRALAQIALAEQALGRWGEAERHLTSALRAEADSWISRNRALLEQAMGSIQERLGSLELLGGVRGAEVQVNGQPAGTLPLPTPLRVPAGSAVVVVRAPDHVPFTRTVFIPAKGLARETIALVPVPAAAPPPSPPPVAVVETAPPPAPAPQPPPRWWRTAGWAALAAAGASLAVGITAHALREGHAKKFNDQLHCGQRPGGTLGGPGCEDQADKVRLTQTAAIAGYGGAALLGGAAAFFLVRGSF